MDLYSIYVSFYEEEIHYCTAHKYYTEAVLDASRVQTHQLI